MPEERERGALLIAACLIAAIRLRGEPIQPSPKLKATIYGFRAACSAGLAGDPGTRSEAGKLTFAPGGF